MNLNEYQNYRETKSHTTAEFPYNTYLCSIPKDFPQVPLHWHAELELIVIKKGRGIVSVDLEKRSVTSGDIILICPGQLHSIEQDQEYLMEYENIIMKPDLLISREQDIFDSRSFHRFIFFFGLHRPFFKDCTTCTATKIQISLLYTKYIL